MVACAVRRTVLIVALLGFGGLAGYLLAWPVPFDPAAWTPALPPGLEGIYEVNDRLSRVERFCDEALCDGLEDIAVAADGRMYGGTQDGRIVVLEPDGSNGRTLATTGGRPLGLHFADDRRLIVADADQGLLALDVVDGTLEVLATEHDATPFRFTDDVDIARDGTIYFTDASWKFPQSRYFEDALEHRPNGRLMTYDPATGRTRLLLDGLYFANGVALAPDESFVLVVETWRYRIRRYWLTGPDAGASEIFVDNLPGVPDGVSSGSAGRFWVALFAPRNARLDAMLPRPFVRKLVWRLPGFLRPRPAHHGFVLGLTLQGEPVEVLHDASVTAFAPITSVQEHDGRLYLGSLEDRGIARLPVP